jgi:hypothetical protein
VSFLSTRSQFEFSGDFVSSLHVIKFRQFDAILHPLPVLKMLAVMCALGCNNEPVGISFGHNDEMTCLLKNLLDP